MVGGVDELSAIPSPTGSTSGRYGEPVCSETANSHVSVEALRILEGRVFLNDQEDAPLADTKSPDNWKVQHCTISILRQLVSKILRDQLITSRFSWSVLESIEINAIPPENARRRPPMRGTGNRTRRQPGSFPLP